MRKIAIGAITAASFVGGSMLVAVANPLGIAGAQDPPPTTAPAAPAPSTGGAPNGAGQNGHEGRGPKVLEDTLKDLVAKGTITQAQSDAIIDALKNKMGDRRGPGGPGGFDPMREVGQVAADTIGISIDELKTEVRSGKSVAEVAQAHGVDPQKVIDAIVAKASARIDEGVAAGKIPADRAAELKQKLPEHITQMVNGHPGDHGPGGKGPGGRHRPGQDGGDNPATPPGNEPAPVPTEPTTVPPTTPAPTTAAPTTAVTPPGSVAS